MSYGATIVSMLQADATLVADLPGGIYLYQDSGRTGLNRIQNSSAFDKTVGLLKPICIIWEDRTMMTGEANDPLSGFSSTVTPVVGWLYDNGNNGFDTITTAMKRMYTLLHCASIQDGFQILWKTTITNRREPLLQDAATIQFVVHVHGFQEFS